MFNTIISGLTFAILALLDKFPGSPFNVDQEVNTIKPLLAKLNWFIPFYKFADIFSVWVGALFVLISFLILVMFIMGLVNKSLLEKVISLIGGDGSSGLAGWIIKNISKS